MAHGDEIYRANGISSYNYKGWKALDASGATGTGDDSGWLDTLGFTKFSLELVGIVTGDKAKIFGTNLENPQPGDAGVLIGSELTAAGFTQFTGSYARLRVTRSAHVGGGVVTALLLAEK